MMKRLSAALAGLLLMAVPAMADVVRTVSTEYYQVDGLMPATIARNLRHDSPLTEGNKTYQANTRTDIRTTYEIKPEGGQCRITNVVVYIHLTYLYPRLKHSVDFKTRKWWKKLNRKLENHELIHGEISTKAAHEISDTLDRFPSSDCANVKKEVSAEIRRIMNRMRQDHIEYDRLTQHGLKQERNMGRYP
ncbi:DUF922 domain-containing protein [Pseudodesulfovibrio thermohalotolerans]|uniref:DUF922 domain-containing protein n=1 Tax=Pseudodesulfovibrio thermohalotolerans TaxID=2880651 RepID=UPI0022BA0CBB|nr:DUF922 domain-containing protein [Pseudodesulfovibrio thermohalotolerans]WFS61202.1 DUF922 domain-containing protein [Pseudodesulfovibrio thermohalotolerans]